MKDVEFRLIMAEVLGRCVYYCLLAVCICSGVAITNTVLGMYEDAVAWIFLGCSFTVFLKWMGNKSDELYEESANSVG
jgi:hypothetical protein